VKSNDTEHFQWIIFDRCMMSADFQQLFRADKTMVK